MKKIIMTLAAVLCCATTVVNAQNTVEENKKMVSTNLQMAEQTVKLADENPTDGQKQYAAATALTSIAANTDGQYDRAISYAHKALEIAKAQKEQKDTLLANTYSLLGNIYLMQGSVDNACDFMELSVDAAQEQLGRYDAVTIYSRLKTGLTLISIYPDTRRGFLHVLQAFYDNDKAPVNKRIKNMDQFNIRHNLAMEQMLTAYTNANRYAVPVFMMDGEKYYIVQTRDWHIGQPLVNWLSPNMLRSQEEREAHMGENIVIMNDKGEFRRLSKEEGQKALLETPNFWINTNSRELETAPSAGYLWYLQPQVYNDTVKRFEEFINKK
ncbi:MAG: tetratricopeptide repeat protein [Prevotella sp.]|nr:tetratricopeptide repeat protein [Prevotella sp.]